MPYEIENYKGITVYVSEHGTFSATVNEKECTDKTLDGLHEKLNMQIKTDLTFKPIDAIEASNDQQLKITSLDRTGSRSHGTYVWVSYLDNRGNKRREKKPLGDYWTSSKYTYFYKATPENLLVLKQIEALKTETAAINEKISALRRTYGNPITNEDVGADKADI
jgi:hypothetical protein